LGFAVLQQEFTEAGSKESSAFLPKEYFRDRWKIVFLACAKAAVRTSRHTEYLYSMPQRGTTMEAVALGKLEALRKQIRTLQASPRTYLATLRTGIPAIDGLMPAGGFPLGKVVELSGEAAAGRITLALQAIAAATREKHLAAYVDGPGELYPPFAAGVGVDLDRLLMVRPKAPRRLVWTALQLARSGAFTCVALDLTHTGVQLSLPECQKLSGRDIALPALAGSLGL
jgi:RecA/RadA recombinase